MDEATLDRARQIAAKQDGLIRWSQLSAVGIDVDGVRRLCRRDIWRRLHREVFLVDAFLYGDGVPARTVIRAAAYAAGPGAVVVASSAAALHGIQGAGIWTGRVELASALSTDGPGDHVVVHQWVIPRADIAEDEGMHVTTAARTAADLVLSLDRHAGLAVLDSVLHLGLLPGLEEVESLCSGRPGVVAARKLLPLADCRAASPLESRVRLECIDGGVPPDELQWAIYDSAHRLLGYGDLAWVRKRRRPLIAEADGVDVHSRPKALLWDRRRSNTFVGSGADIVRFTWADTCTRGAVASAVRVALAAD